MSNLRINIRFLMWHFQVTDDWKCSWEYNSAHKGLKYGWFDVYIFEPFRKKS
jgi:hypothetical protein